MIIDISPLVSPKIAVFPGDTPFKREMVRGFDEGDAYELSSINSTVHLGAHADAPSHYAPDAPAVHELSLVPYLGMCQVIQVHGAPGARIQLGDLGDIDIQAPRVLFRTDSFCDPDVWHDDFNSLSPSVIHWLADQDVLLVGIDTPSVDPANDRHLETHGAILIRELRVLEGLVLSHVMPGLYNLIALPLRLEGCEASPVRAVLLPMKGNSFGNLE